MSKTDFFELPEGDQHRECIEVETDYDRGVMDERKRWESKTCDWKLDDPDWNTYKTGCGQYFNIMEGDLKDRTFKYCNYCGGAINEPKGSK